MIRKIIILLGMLVFLIVSLSFVCCDEVGGETTEIIDIGELIGIGIEKIFGSGINYDKGLIKDFETENSLNINDDKFENIVPESVSGHPTYIRLKSGNIESADITISKEGIYTFNGKPTPFSVPADSRIIFMNGEITVEFPDNGEIKEFSDLNLGETYLTKIRGKNVKLPGEHFLDSGDLYYDGRLFVKAEDEAIIDNIQFYGLEDNVNLYFEKDFKPEKHEGENYFNYGKEKIALGGTGFTANLGEENNVFGDMENEKEVNGIGTKTRNLEFTLNGGNIEIEKDKSKDYLAFDVDGDGDFVIDNSRLHIYSEKRDLSGESELFVKASYKEELTYSYDLNFNEGDYILESNFFRDNKGNKLFNGNLPWETVVYNANKIDLTEAALIKRKMQEEGRVIFVGEPHFLDWIKGETGEAIMKEIYLATEKDGDPLFLYEVLNAEGAGYKEKGSMRIPFFETFGKTPDKEIIGTEIGLTLVGSANNIKRLKEEGYIPENLQVRDFPAYTELTGQYPPRLKAKDAFLYASGVINQGEDKFNIDFKDLYGEEEFNKLTPDEIDYWKTVYYWGPFTSKKLLENRKENYIKVWEGPPVTDKKDPSWVKYLARHRTDFEYYIGPDGLNLFAYP